MSVDPVLAAIVSSSLALLFAAAARHKLTDWTAFRIVVHDYEIVPRSAVTAFAAAVVAAELALAVGFLSPAAAPWPAVGAAMLLTTYSAAIAINLARGRRTLECGCAPSAYRQPLSGKLLARNAALLSACAVACLPVSPRVWSWMDTLTTAGAVVVVAASWMAARALTGIPRVAPGAAGVRGAAA